jgi:hypothetical protein
MLPPPEISLVSKIRALGIACTLDPLMPILERSKLIRAAIDPVLDVTFTIRNGRRITMAMQFADVYGIVP